MRMLKNTGVRTATLILMAWMAQACHTMRTATRDNGDRFIVDLPYGEHPSQRLDVALPAESGNKPAVLIIHGGAWMFGNKSHMRAIQHYLLEHSIPSVNMNYRLLRKDVTLTEQMADVDRAVSYVLGKAPEWKFSPDSLILLGESAGAHLALLYGYQHPETVAQIISLSGPTDFYSDTFLNERYSHRVKATIEKLTGEKYNRDTIPESFIQASPIRHISPVPTLIFQGGRDILVDKTQGKMLDSLLTERNIPHRFIYNEKWGHVPRLIPKQRKNVIFPAIVDWIRNSENFNIYNP